MKPSKLPKINCDLGEGIPREEEIYPLIDCASIACGGHFGDDISINRSLLLAKNFSVKVGAHPSYPDPANFGRKSITIEFNLLTETLKTQIHSFEKVADKLELSMDHIKFHGALYNNAMSNALLAQQLCKWLSSQYKKIPIFVSPGSQMLFWAEQFGLKTRLEVFGDRAYQDNYHLLPRSEAGSLFSTLEKVDEHLRSIILERQIISSSGKKLPVQAETICFHGDNPGLMDFLPIIRQKYWE